MVKPPALPDCLIYPQFVVARGKYIVANPLVCLGNFRISESLSPAGCGKDQWFHLRNLPSLLLDQMDRVGILLSGIYAFWFQKRPGITCSSDLYFAICSRTHEQTHPGNAWLSRWWLYLVLDRFTVTKHMARRFSALVSVCFARVFWIDLVEIGSAQSQRSSPRLQPKSRY